MSHPTSFDSAIGIASQFIFFSIEFICITLAINGNYKLFKFRREIFMEKRSAFILFGLNISLMIQMLNIIPGFISRLYVNPLSFWNALFLMLTTLCWYTFLFFSITKSWMIYYKERWTFYTLQSEWQQHIVSNDDHKNWFIRNNYRFGSLSYMHRLFGIYHTLVAVLVVMVVAGWYLNVVGAALISIASTLPFAVSILMFIIIIGKTHRLPLMDDIFFIHWEARRHTQILCMFLAMFVLNQLCVVLINDVVVETYIFSPIYCIAYYLMHHVSTYGIFNKNNYLIKPHSMETSGSSSAPVGSMTSSTIPITSPSLTLSVSHSKESSASKKIKLRQILSNDNAFHLFMLHLSKEYSMECLLSYTEMIQYAEYISDGDGTKPEIESPPMESPPARLPKGIPTSGIVAEDENRDFEESVKLKGYKLYKKYIEEGSEFEINISWEQRVAADRMFKTKALLLENNGIKTQDIVCLFRTLTSEMFTLLNYSHSRFIHHPDYSKAVALF